MLVMSDTHGDTTLAEKVLKKHQDADIVIHLGDYFRDADRLHELYPKIRFEVVYATATYNRDVAIENCWRLKASGPATQARYSLKWE